MDAKAYLLSQGWSGPGTALNSNDKRPNRGGLGLTKPILVAQKRNNFGIGKKLHDSHANEWWLKGFDAALKNIASGGNSSGSGSGIATPVVDEGDRKHAGLYGCFVRGEGLEGTIEEEERKGGMGRKRKRKREEHEGDEINHDGLESTETKGGVNGSDEAGESREER